MSNLNKNRFFQVIAAFVVVVVISSCTKSEDSAGYEYMPDMYRSPAIEAYTDYGLYRDIEHDSLKNSISARIPAEGTIPYTANVEDARVNMPYPFENTEAGYEAAGAKLQNPLEPTAENLEEGKNIYQVMCIHCHGEKGKGDGAVVVKGGHAPPGAYDGPLKDLSVGKMFHTLTYGKGVMGSHASQLSKKERWQVILHVQTLQGNEVATDSTTAQTDTLEVVEPEPAAEVGNGGH